MKKVLLSTLLLFIAIFTSAQEWEDPVTTNDWNELWKSSFEQSKAALNAPESSGWIRGLNYNHS